MQILVHTRDLSILLGLSGLLGFSLGLSLGNVILYLRWRKYQTILDNVKYKKSPD